MKEDTWTRSEADAAHVARDLGRNQAISGMTAYDCEPNELLDETRACSVCERGHRPHACRWCIGLGKTLRRTA